MKKLSLFLGALLIVGTTVSAKEVIAEPIAIQEPVVVAPVMLEESSEEGIPELISEATSPEWKFGARVYLETEDLDNGSKLTGGDNEDGTFIGTGVSASKGKWTLDLNVERRFGGDISLLKGGQEWEATRVDWKVRYQLFTNQAFHLKYRNEERTNVASFDKTLGRNISSDSGRDRLELGTDWNHFDGLFAGWFVVGHDKDKSSRDGVTSKSDGNYYEGDFGPTFKLTEKLSLNTTLYVTGENYSGNRMNDYQARVMLIWKATDNITIMPRIRYNLEKTDRVQGKDNWTLDAGDRIRYELMANIQIKDNLSSFVGVAYDDQTRDYKGGDNKGSQDIDMWWTFVGLNYSF